MSIHIFSFERGDPSANERLARVHNIVCHLKFSDSNDIRHIADFLFVKKYDVSIKIDNQVVCEVDISKIPSRYSYGSLTIS